MTRATRRIYTMAALGLSLVAGLAAGGCDLLAGGGNGDQLGCGDGRCDAGETSATCPPDCEPPAGRPCTVGGMECDADEQCINNVCVPDDGDDAVVCGDGDCDPSETLLSCPADCINDGQLVCGDGDCDPGETVLSCPIDCLDDQGEFCGNGRCELGETGLNCPADCIDDDDDGFPDGCTPACIASAQCDDGDNCTVDACVPAPAECGNAFICQSRLIDCPFGQRCVAGRCEEQELCFENSDCPIGQVCVNGQCVSP